MSALPSSITIGQLAERSGVATSALRFYEERGLISSTRTSGNQRRYPRSALRKVAVIRAAQQMGLSLAEIEAGLDSIGEDRTLTKRDWQRLSLLWRAGLNERIAQLERLRDQADTCIGCGCLSLTSCGLLNPSDTAADRGPGNRLISPP